MTPNETAVAELEKENATTSKSEGSVENNVSIHKDSSMYNYHIANSTVPRELQSQYEAFLTDPRRI